jgi:hypothetical protein
MKKLAGICLLMAFAVATAAAQDSTGMMDKKMMMDKMSGKMKDDKM